MEETQFDKKLTTYGLTMIAIGSCIGSGIFATPAGSLDTLPHYGWVFLPWILGGIATYMGAMTFAELGARYPKTGGVYIYLREAFGPLAGFLYGWIILLIVNTGALAALSVMFVDLVSDFVPIEGGQKQVVAVCTILGLSVINVFGVKTSQRLASLFTNLKLLALVFIIILGIYAFFLDMGYWREGLSMHRPEGIAGGILTAFIGVFWSFGGWHHTTYLSGETSDPQRSVPKAMLYGTMSVTAIYLCVIFAYLNLAPMSKLQGSEKIALDAVEYFMSKGSIIVSLGIIISIFGTIAIYTMTAPRIYYAMAKDGVFFKQLAIKHSKYKTPHYAIMFQAIWACVLVLIWEKFYHLITFVTFMDIVFMALATASIFVFRARKEEERPVYMLRAYPLIPIIYLLITIAFVGYTLLDLRSEAWVGMALLLCGVPTYYLFSRKRS